MIAIRFGLSPWCLFRFDLARSLDSDPADRPPIDGFLVAYLIVCAILVWLSWK